MKKFFLLLFFLLLSISGTSSFAAPPPLEVDNTYIDMGSIEPGKGGWDFSTMRDAKIGVTCNVAWPFTLKVTLDTMSGGIFDPANIKLKIYYIGYETPAVFGGAPVTWNSVVGDAIAPFLGPGFDNNNFISYIDSHSPGIWPAWTLLSSTAPFLGSPTKVKMVLGVTITVPEAGSNIAGDYLSRLRFDLN